MTARPHMPASVQRDAALIAAGLDPATVEYHHEPPLSVRPYDEATGRWTPDANDPWHIAPMAKADHAMRTPADITTAAKVKRLTKAQEKFRATLLARETGDDPPRNIKRRQWPSRPMQSRPFPKAGGQP